ncbi:hypothetical protein BH24CHL3_BH24CHL3_06400 [soil metagenome]
MLMLPTTVVRDASEVSIEPGAGNSGGRHTGRALGPRGRQWFVNETNLSDSYCRG